jgi:hypothetical protein
VGFGTVNITGMIIISVGLKNRITDFIVRIIISLTRRWSCEFRGLESWIGRPGRDRAEIGWVNRSDPVYGVQQ